MEKALEGTGKVPRIVQVMYFKGMPKQLNQQQDMGLPQQWEAQWQEFLKTLQPAHMGWGNLQLTDSVPWDDARKFLAAFEQVAEACRWPREEWVDRLLPAFRGGVEQYFCRLDARERSDYGKIKAAILRAEALRMEMKRQHFRQCCYQEIEGPRRAYSRLQELCHQWLKPERNTKEQILEMIIQEQLLGMLPTEVQNWVRECGPEDCVAMVALAEDYLMGRRRAGKAFDWQVPLSEVGPQDSEGRPRHHFLGASEIASSRNLNLTHPPAGLETAGVGTPEEPIDVKDGLNLDQNLLHWEAMHENSSNTNSLEGVMIPSPDGISQTNQPRTIFPERLEPRDQTADSLFGGRIVGEIKIETFQQAISEAGDEFERLPAESPSSGSMSTEISTPSSERQLHPKQQQVIHRRRRQRKTIKRKGRYYPPEKRHTCPVCGEKTYYLSDLLRHMKKHEAKKIHKCLECGKTYKDPLSFERHQKIHLPLNEATRGMNRMETRTSTFQPKEEYICCECGITKSTQSSLMEHMQVHTVEKPPHECPECGKTFKWQSNLSRHRRLHLYRRFSSRQLTLRGEERSRHVTSVQEQIKLEDSVGAAVPAEKPRNYRPLRVYSRRNAASKKMNTHSCSICGYQSPRMSDVVKHSRVHTGEKPYKCLECGSSFRWSSTLSKHQRLHASVQQTPAPTPNTFVAECDVTLSDDEELINILTKNPRQEVVTLDHPRGALPAESRAALSQGPLNMEASSKLRSKEWHGRRRTALFQGKAAVKKKNKNDHRERKHVCLNCGHRTRFLSDLVRHKKCHSNEEPYQCPDCERLFVQPSALKIHLNTHKKPRMSAKSIKDHHQGKRKHTCLKCGHKSFKLSTHLLHMRGHEEEGPFKCDECGRGFKYSSGLSRHNRIHTFNTGLSKPKKTVQRKQTSSPLKKRGRQPSATTLKKPHVTAAMREHWRLYKRKQRAKVVEQRQRAAELQRARTLEQRERAAELQRQRAAKEQRERAAELQRERAAKEQRERAAELQREKAAKEQREREAELQRERAAKEQREREAELQRERAAEEQREREAEMERERAAEMRKKAEESAKEAVVRARLEKFAYIKGGETEKCQEEKAPSQKIQLEELRFECTVCGKRFMYEHQLTGHQNTHSEGKSLPGSEYGKCIVENELARHQDFHSGAKPFHCSECQKGFFQKETLLAHLKVHGLLPGLECTECGKTFQQKEELERHQKCHAGQSS